MPVTNPLDELVWTLPAYPVRMPPKELLVETDGVPLESAWHHAAISLLKDSVTWHWRHRDDFYVGGNMFIYFCEQQARNKNFRGPDFFFVDGVERFRTRGYWAVWEEGGRVPDAVMELLSPSTAQTDRTTKKAVYEQLLRTKDYYCYDPDEGRLDGWRLGLNQRYQPLTPNDRGWLWCEAMQFWIGFWTGEYLGERGTFPRFFTPEGELVLTAGEAEHQRAEHERLRAEAERQRAEVAEAKVAQLQARLAELEMGNQAGNGAS